MFVCVCGYRFVCLFIYFWKPFWMFFECYGWCYWASFLPAAAQTLLLAVCVLRSDQYLRLFVHFLIDLKSQSFSYKNNVRMWQRLFISPLDQQPAQSSRVSGCVPNVSEIKWDKQHGMISAYSINPIIWSKEFKFNSASKDRIKRGRSAQPSSTPRRRKKKTGLTPSQESIWTR